MDRGQRVTRRQFLKTAGALLALGGIWGIAARALTRPSRLPRQVCVNQGVCRGCTVYRDCGLPAALSARERGMTP